jgi:hypothetical protein
VPQARRARAGEGLRPEELTATRGTRGRSAMQIRSRLRCAGRGLHVERVAAHQRMRRRTVRRCQPCRGPILAVRSPAVLMPARGSTAQTEAAAGMRTKTGIAHRLCSCPAQVGPASGAVPTAPSGACWRGGKPATGSVTKSPAPINPTPAPKISAGTTAGPTTCLELCARPRAAMHGTGYRSSRDHAASVWVDKTSVVNLD